MQGSGRQNGTSSGSGQNSDWQSFNDKFLGQVCLTPVALLPFFVVTAWRPTLTRCSMWSGTYMQALGCACDQSTRGGVLHIATRVLRSAKQALQSQALMTAALSTHALEACVRASHVPFSMLNTALRWRS